MFKVNNYMLYLCVLCVVRVASACNNARVYCVCVFVCADKVLSGVMYCSLETGLCRQT